MKQSRILVFMLAVMALLAGISILFPQGERMILGKTLQFPTIKEVMQGDGPSVPEFSPEELIEQRKQAVAEAGHNRSEEFFETSPARFYLPEGDPGFFDPVFEALENAGETPVRIVHYGDSQIEEDRISGTVRAALQDRFGGYGPGYMPAARYFTSSVGSDTESRPERYSVFGEQYEGRDYGPFGDFVRADSTIRISWFQVRPKDRRQMPFNRMTVLAGNVRGSLSLGSGGTNIECEDKGPYGRYEFRLRDSSMRTSLSISGHGDIYGVLLDSDKGVHLDNVAMRGCSGLIFRSMSRKQLRKFYRDENVRLILLQYGGNSVPYTTSSKAISSYAASLGRQISYLQELAPDARIVLIGPSDMATLVKGKRQTYPSLPEFVDSLKSAANAAGAAYWDIYGAMGGWNSMTAWVNARPALAGSDHIHFTTAGAEKIGEMFSDSFLLYYDHYKSRRKKK